MVLGKPGPASACPQNCVCYPTPMTVSCQAQNFTAVPVGVPYESQRVFLQNNRITELRVGSFGFGTQVLWLFSNNITWIEAGAFSELRDLEELDLGDNPSLHRLEGGLTALPHDIFHKLYSLQFLYLQYWANYGNEDSGISVRCFELECPPEFDTPSSSSPAPSVLSILSLSLLTVPIHLLFG
uniref:Reticulon 4 receptor-like 2 a n=1 Tax=Neogobius melanostomus TaxID=47308 RepID=A0A8C6WK80_9GOBI